MQSSLMDEPLVVALYDTALYGGGWQAALDRFRCLSNSAEATLTIWDGRRAIVDTTGGFLTPQLRESYIGYYRLLDPKNRIFAAGGTGFLFNDADHFDDAFVARDPFYQEFSRQIGTRHTLDMLVEDDGRTQIFLAVMRTKSQGAYRRAAAASFHTASRHFARVLALRKKIETAQSAIHRAHAAFDQLGFGLTILDRDGRVLVANAPFAAACADGEELRLKQGRLSARSEKYNRMLETAIAQATRRSGCVAQALRLPRAHGRHWTVRIAPLPPAQAAVAGSEGGALMLVGDPFAGPRASRNDLMELYGFTNAEAALALALAGGQTLAQAAAARDVKRSTARTQLLSILRKTGLHSQTALVRMLTGLPNA